MKTMHVSLENNLLLSFFIRPAPYGINKKSQIFQRNLVDPDKDLLVVKKIDSFWRSFRKELKKIDESNKSGTSEETVITQIVLLSTPSTGHNMNHNWTRIRNKICVLLVYIFSTAKRVRYILQSIWVNG